MFLVSKVYHKHLVFVGKVFDSRITTQWVSLGGCTNVDDFVAHTCAHVSSSNNWTMFGESKVLSMVNIVPMWSRNYFSNIACASQVYFSFLAWLQLVGTKFNHLSHGITKKCKLRLTLFQHNFSQHGHFIPSGLVLAPWQSRLHLQKPREKMGLERGCGIGRRCCPRLKMGIWVSPKKG
jgi:hypothetical protein